MLTFLNLPQTNQNEADIIILPVATEFTTSYRKGTKNAPKAILDASSQLEYWDEELKWEFNSITKIFTDEIFISIKDENNIDFLSRLREKIKTFNKNKLLFSIGGEHSMTAGIASEFLTKKSTIVQIDAHSDLRDIYENSKYSHACPMRRLTEEGHNIFQIGIRAQSKEEYDFANDNKQISIYYAHQLRYHENFMKMLGDLKNIDGDVYFSVDVDGLDPSVIPSTGTPVAGGLTWWQLIDIIKVLIFESKANIKACDLVEVVPESDNVLSSFIAAQIMFKIISFWGYRNKKMKTNPILSC